MTGPALLPPSVEPSVVYCIVHFERKAVKIGVTTNVTRRLRQLQAGCSDRLQLFDKIEGDSSLERAFHLAFADRRRTGEWFENADHKVTDLFGRLAWECRMGKHDEALAA